MFMDGLGRRGFVKKLKKVAKKASPYSLSFSATKLAAKTVKKVARPVAKIARKSFILPVTVTRAVVKKITPKKKKLPIELPKAVEKPEVVATVPEPYREAEEIEQEQEQEQEQEREQEQPQEQENYYPYESGDPDGGEPEAVDGLGKKFWTQKKFKKGLRKTVLIAGTGAALYFTGGAVAAALAKRKAAAAAAAANAPSGDYQPEAEYGSNIGYEGQQSASVPGGPTSTSDVFDSAAKVITAGGKLIPVKRKVADGSGATSSVQEIMDSLFTGKNIALIGAASALAVILFVMRKGKK